MTAVTVVVDFGSANTVAVARAPGRLVTVEPSVVLLSRDDQLVAGREALSLVVADPSRLLTGLKSRLAEREVMVGDIVLPVTGLVRALFSRIVRSVDGPVDELVLTHPVGWPTERVAVLTRAAGGLASRITTVAAPVATAAGAGIEPGATVLVVDFGAASCEVAAVRRSEGKFEVLAHGSLPLGGDDLDARVYEHLGESVDARARKEQVVDTGAAENLTGADFERLVADDVARVVELVERVVAESAVDRVLLVGGSSRVPMLGRRVAEAVPRPVRLAPDPEHAVAWGALRWLAPDAPEPAEPVEASSPLSQSSSLSNSSLSSSLSPSSLSSLSSLSSQLGPSSSSSLASSSSELGPSNQSSPSSRQGPSSSSSLSSQLGPAGPLRPLRRRAVLAAALLVLALAAAAVGVIGIGPGRLVAGVPVPAGPPVPSARDAGMPPEVAGREVVTPGQPAFAAGRMGTPVRYRHPSGTTLELLLAGVRAERTAAVSGDAPLGYRWVTVTMSATNVSGPAWRQEVGRDVAALDDRGQWIRPLDGGAVACAPGSSLPETVRSGDTFEACVLLPVPEATPVTAVVFGTFGGGAPPPVRFPVSVPAVSSARPAPARVVGRLGEPAVEVNVDGVAVRAGFDLVLTPSGYLGDRRPGPGNRYVVVRGQLPAKGSAEHVYLRDDRGVLTHPVPGFDTMPDCPPFGVGDSGGLAYACFVYELDVDTPVAGVTLGSPLEKAGEQLERWPTWTVA